MGTAAQKRAAYKRTRAENRCRDPYAAGGTRVCHKCEQSKVVTDFGRDVGGKDGLKSVCRDCRNRMQRVYNNGGKYESYRDNAPVHNKACSFCGERKVLDDFPTQKAGRAGRNARCRVCCNLHVRSQAYEISVDAIHTMLEKQDGRCAACSVDLKMSGRGRDSFVVDHCHSTGDVRGLLCGICNRALGMLGDNAETVGALYRYIRDSQ